jgi:hypothetical protein
MISVPAAVANRFDPVFMQINDRVLSGCHPNQHDSVMATAVDDAIQLQIDYVRGCFKDADGDLDGNMSVDGLLHSISVEENLNAEDPLVNAVLRLRFIDNNDSFAPPVDVSIDLTEPRLVLTPAVKMVMGFMELSGSRKPDDRGSPMPEAMKILAKLNAADLTKPVSIKPWLYVAGDGDVAAEGPAARVMVAQMDCATGSWKDLTEDYGNGVAELPRPQPKKAPANMPELMQAYGNLLDPLSMMPGDQLDQKPGWVPLMHELLNSVSQKTVQQQRQEESPDDWNEEAQGMRPRQC